MNGQDEGTFDPNRDFPYFSDKTTDISCMNTITARTVNELYREFMFILAITFHGGDNVIGYPWGNYAHVYSPTSSKEAPDLNSAKGNIIN